MKLTLRLLFLAWICVGLTQTVGAQAPAVAQATASTLGINGTWRGMLTVPGQKYQVVINITQPATGPVSGTFDLPEAGALGLPIEHLAYADRIISFDVNIGAPSSYEGALSRDSTELVGYLQQGANFLPMNLTKSDGKPDANAVKPAIRQNAGRKIELQPCGTAGITKDALCGQLEVFEDRAKNTGRKIKLNIVILPALIDKPAPDPIFYLLGGPGGAATTTAPAWFMTRLHRTRDVVLVDQRGTGKSNPLQCNFRGDPSDMRGLFVEGFTPESVRACRAELDKIADLRLYTTTIAMADLDDVRAALGYDKINVYGGSYGATTTLSYLNLYPQHVRTATISGIAPPSVALPLTFATGVEHALNRLLDDCAAEEKCRAAFPDLRKDWATVLANTSKGPVTFDTLDPVTKQKQQITMSREGFAELVRHVLYNPSVMSIMPLLIHQMSQGDYSQFAYYAYQLQRAVDSGIARGMQFSVICAEDIPFLSEPEIEKAMVGTFYGSRRAHLYIEVCAQWPRGEVPAKFRAPIKSDVPVFMLSGELDPVTPPEIATPLLRWLPNGKQVVMHNATHAPYPCSEKLAREFIEAGSWKGLDTSCVEGIKRLPFVTTLPPLAMPK